MISTKKQTHVCVSFETKVISKEKGLPQKKKRFPFPDGSPHRASVTCISNDHPRRFSDPNASHTLPFPTVTSCFDRGRHVFPSSGGLLPFRNKRSPWNRFGEPEAPFPNALSSADGGDGFRKQSSQLAFWGNTRASTIDHCVEMEPLAVRRSLRGWFGSLVPALCMQTDAWYSGNQSQGSASLSHGPMPSSGLSMPMSSCVRYEAVWVSEGEESGVRLPGERHLDPQDSEKQSVTNGSPRQQQPFSVFCDNHLIASS